MRTSACLARLSLLAIALAAGACTRTEDGVRIEGDEAAARVEEAGERAGEALDEAGERVGEAAAEVERRAGPVAEDAAITAKVKAKLAADPEVAAVHIDVDTLDHVVTLSGRVASPAVRDEADKLTRGTEGVRAVVNNLIIAGEPVPGSPAAAASPAATPQT
jgi:hyperosmotically inducible periplasmic protein